MAVELAASVVEVGVLGERGDERAGRDLIITRVDVHSVSLRHPPDAPQRRRVAHVLEDLQSFPERVIDCTSVAPAGPVTMPIPSPASADDHGL
jgi:hypothetical protein